MQLFLLAKCHFSTSVFKHFSSNNQLPGFYISGTLVKNGLGINFPLSDSIKLVIINITYTCLESYALGYYRKKLIKILNSCLKKLCGFFFLKSGFRSDSLEKFWANSSVGWVLSRNSLQDSGQLLLIMKIISICICRPSLLNQKHNMGWYLQRGFEDLA